MQAVILAAGMGKRLKELTKDNTKCMVKVNGVSLIERMLSQLDALSLSRIVIVVGYRGADLISYIKTLGTATPLVFIDNPVYDKTNNIYSLSLAGDYLAAEDTLILESDLIFEDSVLTDLINDERDSLALVDKYESWMDGTCIKITDNDEIREFIPGSRFRFSEADEYYKTVNIYKFSRKFSNKFYLPFLNAYLKALGENEYYEQVLRVISYLDEPCIFAKKLTGQKWYEIDDVQDLDIAGSIFEADGERHYDAIMKRYGGYWRYPGLLDFSNPGNPYFPSRQMRDEMMAMSNRLLDSYPSGRRVINLLLSKYLGVQNSFLLATNGIEECNDIILDLIKGRIGVVKPVRVNLLKRLGERAVIFDKISDDLSFSADMLTDFFSSKDISSLYLYNPGYHTGVSLPGAEVEKLLAWCSERNITFIYDESNLDFAGGIQSLADNEILNKHKNLIVLKDLAVSHGVLGLRLSSLMTSDTGFIDEVNKKLSCWNMDSFAEFYLQIVEKYSKAYKQSVKDTVLSRNKLLKALEKTGNIRVIPSDSDFFICEILNSGSSRMLASELLNRHNILVRDVSPVIDLDNRQFIKIAVRNDEDNERLIKALERI